MASDLVIQDDGMKVERETIAGNYSQRVQEILLAQPLNPLVILSFQPIARHAVGRSPLTAFQPSSLDPQDEFEGVHYP